MKVFTLKNKNDMAMKVSSYGGIVMEIHVPDRDGNFADVALGFDTVEQCKDNGPYLGALIGRYGNRIAKGKYSIDGTEYSCPVNNGENSLHGGLKGFDKAVWDAREIEGEGFTGLELGYLSKDGEEGYPGNLDVKVVYKLTDDNEWVIEYTATTDKPTVLNLTQHSYFNLSGHDSGLNYDHLMKIDGDAIIATDEGAIPTGEIYAVEGTPFDFRQPKTIGADIEASNQQLVFGRGYDHTYVLNSQDGSLAVAALVYEPQSGRTMEVSTTEPGVQFYSGNFLDGTAVGKGGVAYQRRAGFCLETQHYPDSPNQPQFPSTRLSPGETFNSTTIYTFGVR